MSSLNTVHPEGLEQIRTLPVTVLQIGEGNFLRGFFDWMMNECIRRNLFPGSIAVMQPRPSGQDSIARLASQDGLYTLVTRGLEAGVPVSRTEIISVFSKVFDPYTEWEEFKRLAVSPGLRVVVSNTTEAGLSYLPEPLGSGPILSFPGKIAYLLYLRYTAYPDSSSHGLIFLPCELLERNGEALRDAVLKYADDWGFSAEFKEWVIRHNRFLNSLVDRIVTGYPEEAQAEAWFEEWGYRDRMLCTAEPYHLWAIEAEPELGKLLPFHEAGLNVHWTNDLVPFQQRKVRILNGMHTWMAPLGLLYGVGHVRELLEHEELGERLRLLAGREIIPALPYPAEEMEAYAAEVRDRFANPHIVHRLSAIAMNSLSKFRIRLLPSLAWYEEQGRAVPEQLMLGLAGLLRYYKVNREPDGTFTGTAFNGQSYTVSDNAAQLERMAEIWSCASAAGEALSQTVNVLLAEELFWGQSLAEWACLADNVTAWLTTWERMNTA
ncbi:tagaturonate reductase [Paenibacillus sp. HW567]|uniref:tagaturonate reductase n=1 Tax=Paenibacillus sp. HW567 TaxID=1034769 RepID=UPI00037B8674|nr:tagaturonate reductase [Paenibacillus sp. HW567]